MEGGRGRQGTVLRETGELIGFRDLRFTGLASVESPAFGEELRPGGPVDCAIYTATAQERRICGVDNCGDIVGLCNITCYDFKFWHSTFGWT